MYSQVDEILKAGVIQPLISNYCSPSVMIKREGKAPRFCVDYRRFNKLTQDKPAVLPRIDENLKDLDRAIIYTLIDLKAGYWQNPMGESSKKYTAFATPDGAIWSLTYVPTFYSQRRACGVHAQLLQGVLGRYTY